MLKNPWFIFSMLVFLFMGSCVYMVAGSLGKLVPEQAMAREDSILYVKLDGVIIDGEDILEDLRKYAKDDKIKGVLVRVNSPGGVVGPSQEIYAEILRIREQLKKPVYISANALMASGAYYVAAAADKIYVNPGTLMGSIGVIMEFANLSDLYSWAKIQRYALTSGQYKNTGTETRAMRDDEKQLLQSLIDDVHNQFKQAIAKGRNLRMVDVNAIADGRIFTGELGVKYGLADVIGTEFDALNEMAKEVGLAEPKIFYPRQSQDDLMELFGRGRALFPGALQDRLQAFLPLELFGKPLFIMPQYIK